MLLKSLMKATTCPTDINYMKMGIISVLLITISLEQSLGSQ